MTQRWKPDAAGRLEAAALELFGQQGYDHTTVAQIAGRAGLTERTYFRHFADKREVLFYGQDRLHEFLAQWIGQAADVRQPVQVIVAGLETAMAQLDVAPEKARARGAVIAANAELREREQHKLAAIATATAEALERRGVKRRAAQIAAEFGVLVFKLAYQRWIAASGRTGFATHIRATYEELRGVAASA